MDGSLVATKRGYHVEAIKRELCLVGDVVWVQLGEKEIQSRKD